MGKYLLLAFFLFFPPLWVGLGWGCVAQNLVPNPSFEDKLYCPRGSGADNIFGVNSWTAYLASPDYYNRCSTDITSSIPVNGEGYQEPYIINDSAYVGIFTYLTTFKNYREYLGAQLISPIIIGHKYYVSLMVSLADSSSCSANNVGINFSTVEYADLIANPRPAPIFNRAVVYSRSIISDKINWTLISGSFIADSAYKYIIIGNFFSDSLTKLTGTSNCFSYYYIDNICVSQDSSECIMSDGVPNSLNENLSIYPNPAIDKIYFKSNVNVKYDCSLVNLLGIAVKTFPDSKTNAMDVSDIPNGIYFLLIHYQDMFLLKKQIIIH